MECENADAVAAKIVELRKDKLPRYYHIKPETIQILTPMQWRGVGKGGRVELCPTGGAELVRGMVAQEQLCFMLRR